MKGKLIKTQDGFVLLDDESNEIGQTFGKFKGKKLSLKNCQAIENGYDFDEYQEGVFYAGKFGHPSPEGFSDEQVGRLHGFIDGFQKALEILGDKKFSEDDVKKAYTIGWNSCNNFMEYDENHELIELPDCIQSLQQNEWEVEIEMICPHPEDTYTCGMQYGCDEDGCNHPEQVPYLDEDGCLILKRILNQ